METIGAFFGHADYRGSEDLASKIKAEIISAIKEKGLDTFYIGGIGGFDSECAKYIKEIKTIFPTIKSYLILSYPDQAMDDYQKIYVSTTFDGTIYPPLEKVPRRFAILKRNEWIVQQADYIFFYVNYSWGGASKFLDYAIKKKKQYINFGIRKRC